MRRASPTFAKRWTLELALCLLAGAVVTWGVAWGCAVGGPFPQPEAYMRLGDSCPERTAANWSFYDQWHARTFTVEVVFSRGEDSHGLVLANDVRFGFPMRSMRLAERGKGGNSTVTTAMAVGFITRLNRDSYGLPASILPLGFSLNTLFYAAVLLGIVECVALARRRVRRGKGRCPSCGYDRAGLAEGAACPECGGKA